VSGPVEETFMVSPAPREDVLFTANRLLRDAMDGMSEPAPAQDGTRFSDISVQLHRQAAQYRNGRLRTIEALRRPRK
jgi:hypothetical protein